MKIIYRLAAVMCGLSFAGCAEFTHFNVKKAMTDGDAAFIDAKQRAIYDVKVPVVDDKKGVVAHYNGYCAEPSPDAISALAASLGVDLTVTGEGKLGLSNTIAEGVSNIGVRTAAIQALRDFMYRNCEAYAIGGISQNGLETLQRRFQSTMVAILAIEQLTGAVQSPPVTIHADAGIGSPDAVLELTQKSELAKSQLEEAQSSEKKEKEKVDAASAETKTAQEAIEKHNEYINKIEDTPEGERSDDDKTKLANKDETLKSLTDELENKKEAEKQAKDKLDSASDTTKKKQQAYDAIESSRVAATTGGGAAKVSATYAQSITPEPISQHTANILATAVENIVDQTTGELSFWTEVCATMIGRPELRNATPEPNSALSVCLKLMATSDNPDKREQFLNKFLGFDFEPPAVDERLRGFQNLLSRMNFKGKSGEAIKIDGKWGAQMEFVVPKFLQTCSSQIPEYKNTAASLENIGKLIKAAQKARRESCGAS